MGRTGRVAVSMVLQTATDTREPPGTRMAAVTQAAVIRVPMATKQPTVTQVTMATPEPTGTRALTATRLPMVTPLGTTTRTRTVTRAPAVTRTVRMATEVVTRTEPPIAATVTVPPLDTPRTARVRTARRPLLSTRRATVNSRAVRRPMPPQADTPATGAATRMTAGSPAARSSLSGTRAHRATGRPAADR